MDKKNIQKLSLALILLVSMVVTSYSQNAPKDEKQKQALKQQKNSVKYKVTFIELGSVRCIPCQKMQVVMKSIEKKYSDQVKIDFQDVWTEKGKPYAIKYGIHVIPTQIFLDKEGKEFFRHEGFFPEEELVKILKSKGIKD